MSDSDPEESEPEEDPWWTDESLPPIVRAARDGDLQTLRRELAAGADPFSTGEEEHPGSLIHLVCERRNSVRYGTEPQAEELNRVAIVEELLAAGVPPDLLDETSDWTVTFYASNYNRPLILAALIKAAGPNAAALVTTHRGLPRGEGPHGGLPDYWSDLQIASMCGHAECVRVLLSAGAGSGINDRNPINRTALDCAIRYGPRNGRRYVFPLLLAAGATIPSETTDAYLRKVAATGGFHAYEKARRQELATKFAAKAFPRLPTDVAAQVVAFAFHVGYY